MLLLAACRQQPAARHLEPDAFAQIYSDAVMQLVDVGENDSLSASERDSVRAVLLADSTRIDSLLASHGTTAEAFEQSMRFYDEHPKLWLEVFARVEEKLTKLDKDGSSE